ncbi:recombinase family protein [Acetatifactor muris]|jgi:DNA invertase Pin-like site-specific DNA recombinase|uniref:Transposon Tn552 DNA-invertase bin3 n=1 Tax=Acetatifactor muris TaxID=879566 RepID=A0A2K4ZD83_9FIRM|nr:recombinase family protein [Acetatifactor muris]MCR2046983.1 recombinase family protein [Acetatifactor muris]SOY28425.1 Putative transposon Tn552 DNA-invertase bin3 [Acetatifactor muris]
MTETTAVGMGNGNEGRMYGYIRVSTKEQNEDRQRIAMKECGILDGNVYSDRQSGKNFDRPGYQAVVSRLQKGDTLVIKSLDRLGRNFDEILEQWRFITVEKQVGIIILDIPLLGDLNKDLMGRVVAQLMLTLMSYMAETERINIRQRQAEGIQAARQRGVKFGRRPKEVAPEFEEIYGLWTAGSCSARAAGRKLGISSHTFMKWVEARKTDQDICSI